MNDSETRGAGLTRAPCELEIGPLTLTDIVRFAGASGDFNPLHHDSAFAHASGFPGVFSMGQLPAGVLSRVAVDWLGLDRILSYRVRFTDKVWPGDALCLIRGECSARFDGGLGTEVLDCTLRAIRQDGVVVVEGWAVARAQVTSLSAPTQNPQGEETT